jgi:hypothetical protein
MGNFEESMKLLNIQLERANMFFLGMGLGVRIFGFLPLEKCEVSMHLTKVKVVTLQLS